MPPPLWALALAYWMHMLATVIWIGGLAVFSLVLLPAAQKALDARAYAALLEKLQQRLDPLVWFSVIVLLGSGMLQMSASPHYEGFLTIGNLWAGAILIKHILFGGMILIGGYTTWGVLPALRRAALRRSKGHAAPEYEKLQRRQVLVWQINVLLGVGVLALTALARAA